MSNRPRVKYQLVYLSIRRLNCVAPPMQVPPLPAAPRGREEMLQLARKQVRPPRSVPLGLAKKIVSFDSTQIAKSQLYSGNLSALGEPLRSGLIKLMSPIRVGQS